MIISTLILSTLLTQPPAAPADQTAPLAAIGRQTETDQTVPVTKGTRLDLDDCAGELIVKTWDRDAVRVRATHSRRTRINIQAQGQVLRLEVDSAVGSGLADLDLTVPVWMGLRLEGRSCFVDVENVTGGVSVETVEGDIALRNLGGNVVLQTVEGKVTLEGMRGRTEVSSVEGDITITRSQGEISAESVDGSIRIENSQPTALELSTVDGDLTFSGSLAAQGHYMFTTHDGNVELSLPDNTNATFDVRSFESSRLQTTLPLKQTQAGARGRRTTYTLGSGSARVDIEVFDGAVRLNRQGSTQKD